MIPHAIVDGVLAMEIQIKSTDCPIVVALLQGLSVSLRNLSFLLALAVLHFLGFFVQWLMYICRS